MPRDFDYHSLDYDGRESIHDALSETTLKHIDRFSGLFSHNPFDPAASPSQILETVHLNPAPTKFDEIRGLADIASPSLAPHVRETIGRSQAFMSAARLLLDKHTHIFPVTNHGNIADVAIWSAGWAEALDKEHWQEQNGLIISRGVTTIQAFGMAASEVVQKIGHVFMSFPKTETISALGFDDSLVATNNRKMRQEVNHWLGQDLIHRLGKHVLGKSLHTAWTGKTDNVRYGDNGRPEKITMGKVHGGTIGIVKRGLVLPVVIWDDDEPILELGELTKVENEADALRVQKWQADILTQTLGMAPESVNVE